MERISLSADPRRADPAEAAALYVELGWGDVVRYSSARMRRALAHCDVIISAHNGAGELVGLLRALTDTAIDTRVLDLVIAPEYQRQGLGQRMMARLRSHPAVKGTTIYFETERKHFGFAAKCGYEKRKGLAVFRRRQG